jgi:hypothetical protein
VVVFEHLRKPDYNEQLGVFVSPKGGVTVAYDALSAEAIETVKKIMEEQEGDVFYMGIKVGIARCHSEDLYNKKIGRAVALGRLEQKHLECVKVKTILFLLIPEFNIILSFNNVNGKVYSNAMWYSGDFPLTAEVVRELC